MLRKSAILLAVFILSHWSAAGQQTDYNFINFNSKHGLSSNTVYSIIKDKYGYMWFATEDGLNKFDIMSGNKFTYENKINIHWSAGNAAHE